ncbi:MAG: hypothetical protein COA90_07940 [Gammaproteobacteria bacterium]|nr:MAG: hypothetical protein COA90_07940 [Gammaproteobacteria bacterium]
MDSYSVIKTLHIISSTILFGTGLGIAFFMLRSYFTNDLHEKLYAARGTVLADYIFTFPAVIAQLITGAWLIWQSGYDWQSLWLLSTYLIYAIAGLCWLPVVWIQIQLKKLLIRSIEDNIPLPSRYNTLFRIWFILG